MPAKSAGLEARARTFREAIETHFIDEKGYLIYNLDRRTLRPFTPEALAGKEIALKGDWTYEDTMFLSGLYLYALTEEYLVTSDASVQAIAAKFFDDLQPLLAENDQIEPGYIGKPWGGIPRQSTTLDQTFYFCFGLHRYTEIADAGRKRRAGEIIARNVDWWMRRDYFWGTTPGDETVSGWLGPAFGGAMLAQVFMAYLQTGDRKYREECERLNRVFRADDFPCRRMDQWCPVDERGFKIRRTALWFQSYSKALWLLARHWPERLPFWQERMTDHWRQEFRLGLDETDGLTYLCPRVNLADESEVPLRPEEAFLYTQHPRYEELKKLGLQVSRLWVGTAKSAMFSTFVAMSAVLTAETAPWMAEESGRVLRIVLPKLDLLQMRWVVDADGGQWPEERSYARETLTAKAIIPWLIAYWQGRRLGLIEA